MEWRDDRRTGLITNVAPWPEYKFGLQGTQIKYRYGASVQDAAEKLQYDLYYIKHMSLKLDALIAARTIRTVLFQSGAR